MRPSEACQYAASWGSYMRSGDLGACMYGFSEDCRPQSESHRRQVIEYCKNVCIPMIEKNPEQYDRDELEKMNSFLKYIQDAPLSDS